MDISHVSKLAKEVHPTKRNVVSVAAGIYDPLGIISPTTVQLKMFAQKLCKAKIGLDDALTGVLLSSWESLVNNLQQVLALQIPRFYLSGVDRSSIQYGLHGFFRCICWCKCCSGLLEKPNTSRNCRAFHSIKDYGCPCS